MAPPPLAPHWPPPDQPLFSLANVLSLAMSVAHSYMPPPGTPGQGFHPPPFPPSSPLLLGSQLGPPISHAPLPSPPLPPPPPYRTDSVLGQQGAPARQTAGVSQVSKCVCGAFRCLTGSVTGSVTGSRGSEKKQDKQTKKSTPSDWFSAVKSRPSAERLHSAPCW